MPWLNCMRVPAIHHSLRTNTWASCLRERQSKPPVGRSASLTSTQLLSTGPQVVYPSGLNGQDEPIITTLPELLSSGISIITSEHLYLEIDIPPMEESDTKAPPIGKASIIQTTSPCKSSPKLEGSMTAEVNDLLDQAIIVSIQL